MADRDERPGAFRRQIVSMLNRYRTAEASPESPDKAPPPRKSTRRTTTKKSERSTQRATVTSNEPHAGDEGDQAGAD